MQLTKQPKPSTMVMVMVTAAMYPQPYTMMVVVDTVAMVQSYASAMVVMVVSDTSVSDTVMVSVVMAVVGSMSPSRPSSSSSPRHVWILASAAAVLSTLVGTRSHLLFN